MRRRETDYVRVKALYDEGVTVTEIAKRVGRSKGTISKALKAMGIEVTRAMVRDAPKYLRQRDKELDRLEDLYGRVLEVLDSADHSKEELRLDHIKEARLIIGTIKDVQFKLVKTMVWAELLVKIDEAISNGCEVCQKRIRSVLQSL
jgi:IS30 family transposase